MSYGEFLRGLLKNPRAVSAPTPSGPILSAAMADKVDPLRPGLVVELGAGTGVVTQALVARGIAPERLLVVEYSAFFAALLKERFPEATVIQGDAFAFEQYLPEGAQISAVVCGVPLLNFPLSQRQGLIERAVAVQEEGGRFIQLSYGWKPPIAPGKLKLSKTVIWRNLPPAHVWTYRALPQEMPAREAPASATRVTSR